MSAVARHRLHGEWFSLSKDLIAMIARLRSES